MRQLSLLCVLFFVGCGNRNPVPGLAIPVDGGKQWCVPTNYMMISAYQNEVAFDDSNGGIIIVDRNKLNNAAKHGLGFCKATRE
jgi:hypothetical protein